MLSTIYMMICLCIYIYIYIYIQMRIYRYRNIYIYIYIYIYYYYIIVPIYVAYVMSFIEGKWFLTSQLNHPWNDLGNYENLIPVGFSAVCTSAWTSQQMLGLRDACGCPIFMDESRAPKSTLAVARLDPQGWQTWRFHMISSSLHHEIGGVPPDL